VAGSLPTPHNHGGTAKPRRGPSATKGAFFSTALPGGEFSPGTICLKNLILYFNRLSITFYNNNKINGLINANKNYLCTTL
jgi:hypothetical protein